MAQSATTVTLEQYLATSYRPDVEFLDGELKERPLVSPVHGRVQVLLSSWFEQHEEAWGTQTLVEARTKVSGNKVRLPDVTVLAAGPLPRKALVEAPLLVIEVFSETDTCPELNESAAEIWAMGVGAIWLLDPEKRTAERWAGDAWQPVHEDRMQVDGSPVYLDLAWLWKKLGPHV